MSDRSQQNEKVSRTRLANGARPRYDETDDVDEESIFVDDHADAVMRVGRDYQAQVPECDRASYEAKHDALLVWQPCTDKMTSAKVEEFCKVALEKHKYNQEQALGMLFWHKHDVDKAMSDLANFAPFPDEWSLEEKVLFEQAFNFHGKSFHRIREMLPDKSIAALVKHYYHWKKTRSRHSALDRQAKEATVNEISSDLSDLSDSDMDNANGAGTNTDQDQDTCSNCNSKSVQLRKTQKGLICHACYQYWRRTGLMRPFAPTRSGSKDSMPQRYNPTKNRKRPPKGIYMNEEDLHALASATPDHGKAVIGCIMDELVSLKSQVQMNKQHISLLKGDVQDNMNEYKIAAASAQPRPTPRWSQQELLLAVQGVRRYGKDFEAIANVLGTKAASQVRNFFTAYRRRYNLDQVLEEYEAEFGVKDEEPATEAMEVDETNAIEKTEPPPLVKNKNPGSPRSPGQRGQRSSPKTSGKATNKPPPLIKSQ